jgi:hypothetical protein
MENNEVLAAMMEKNPKPTLNSSEPLLISRLSVLESPSITKVLQQALHIITNSTGLIHLRWLELLLNFKEINSYINENILSYAIKTQDLEISLPLIRRLFKINPHLTVPPTARELVNHGYYYSNEIILLINHCALIDEYIANLRRRKTPHTIHFGIFDLEAGYDATTKENAAQAFKEYITYGKTIALHHFDPLLELFSDLKKLVEKILDELPNGNALKKEFYAKREENKRISKKINFV